MLKLRERDKQAYEQVFNHETLLRRVLRWELRGHFGQHWYGELGKYCARVEDQIQSEKVESCYDPRVSALGYLGLRDSTALITGRHWDDIFKPIFSGSVQKHTIKSGLRSVISVRNKVAHFRPVSSYQVEFGVAEKMRSALSEYYDLKLNAAFHLSGEPEKRGEQFGTTEINRLVECLSQLGLKLVWEKYSSLESMRTEGLSPGFGVVGHHVFYEIYGNGSFKSEPILRWIKRVEHEVTFLNIGKHANYLRVFIPIKQGPREISKCMRGLASTAKAGNSDKWKTMDEIRTEFDFGSIECLNGEGQNIIFSFVF